MVFNFQEIVFALIGGLIIGGAVTVMLLFKGRVTGISGILYGSLTLAKGDWHWRLYFVSGLVFGGVFLQAVYPDSLINSLTHSDWRLAGAGLLVGYGTVLGNGCTSGHGVCGISRFSLRSFVATLTFMVMGVLTVAFLPGGLS